MLLCFACDKPLQFWHFISNLRSYLCSVGVKEVGILFPLLSALLAGLLLQHTLHTSICFASCNRSDPSVLVAGKSLSRAKILVFVSKEKRKMELLLPPSLLLFYTRPETSITSACFSSAAKVGQHQSASPLGRKRLTYNHIHTFTGRFTPRPYFSSNS